MIFFQCSYNLRGHISLRLQKVARASQIILASFPGCGLYYSYGTPGNSPSDYNVSQNFFCVLWTEN